MLGSANAAAKDSRGACRSKPMKGSKRKTIGKNWGKERNEDKLSGETKIRLYYSDKATMAC
jgi:hypothetical protein